MNLYLCSTLRHFLFALLKSLKEIDRESRIIVVIDQQGLEPESFDLSALPTTITVKFIGRKKLLKEIYSGGVGSIHKCFAVANSQNQYFRERTVKKLYESEILHAPYLEEDRSRLFLFNDRNRLARLVRLAFPFYEVIEDGLSNYTGTELTLSDRFFFGKRGRRYIGDDQRCTTIHLLDSKQAPKQILNKVKNIDFIDSYNVNTFLYSIFKLDHLDIIPDVIIATQPISISGMNDSGKDIEIYRKMVEHLESKNCTYAFKVHPRENEGKYKNEFPDSRFIKSKVPLELLVFSSLKLPIVLSVYSSAGMGFESFCHRITLITDDEAENQAVIYNQWKESFVDLNKRLEAIF
ncbi:glycosyltransferase family 52 [Vibrio lentus]|uniref:Lipooligosaccharide sialyltransferase n=1 Tax=Vibrio lentus TaxID=136468 RepID=A0A855IMD8_9VIBR|nr:glycosyltransferase family 52 [Vibrio lentus]PMJ63210.1 hypothetical protein BCU18_20355 [Vibrio lentus]PMJ90771.1 hypothetical protein BCU14_02995 [Vibrio lentus]PMM53405.1 hypothetical protein BCT51_13685 [Vibrio lentus]PMM55406.1 hypothetical protein BCT50_10685 [Vibrio lentus]PMN41979.1 hypothetical protein BCT33_00505 [Vibrio lentus]